MLLKPLSFFSASWIPPLLDIALLEKLSPRSGWPSSRPFFHGFLSIPFLFSHRCWWQAVLYFIGFPDLPPRTPFWWRREFTCFFFWSIFWTLQCCLCIWSSHNHQLIFIAIQIDLKQPPTDQDSAEFSGADRWLSLKIWWSSSFLHWFCFSWQALCSAYKPTCLSPSEISSKELREQNSYNQSSSFSWRIFSLEYKALDFPSSVVFHFPS